MERRKEVDPEGYKVYGLGLWGETQGLILHNWEAKNVPLDLAREMARDLTRTVQSSQSNAERLMRVQIGAQQKAIMDAGYDEYTFLAIGTACEDCRALDEKTFKLKKMQIGLNAPPLHPNCRCAIAPATNDPDYEAWLDGFSEHGLSFEEWKERNISERERIYIHDKEPPSNGHVNTKLVNTEKYHEKYEKLTAHKATNESLYREAMQILSDRNNTVLEEIVALDFHSGERLVKNSNAVKYELPHQCGFTVKEYEQLESSGQYYEVLHNHPNSSIPSRDDIQKLFERKHQVGSTIACHNGSVYRLEKLKTVNNIDGIVKNIYNKVKEKYNEYGDQRVEEECSKQLIASLKRAGSQVQICV